MKLTLMIALSSFSCCAMADYCRVWEDPTTGFSYSYNYYSANRGIIAFTVGDDYNYYYTAVSPTPSGKYVVPSMIDGKPVTYIGPAAFLSCSSITEIVIPLTITSVHNRDDDDDGDTSSFEGCYGITTVTLPGWFGLDHTFPSSRKITKVTITPGSTSVCENFAKGKSTLTSVSIPDSVTSIGCNAFYGCTGLTSVVIPSSVKSIDSSAFEGCSGLTSVTIKEGVSHIGSRAFYGCTGLTSVVIPSSVKSIDLSAFEGCSRLTSVTMKEGVAYVGSRTFYGCTALSNVAIPSSVASIGNAAFYGCSSLGFGIVTMSGCMFCVSNSDRTVLEIGADITCISDDVWEHCPYLKTITVHPDNTHFKVIDGILYAADGKKLVASPKDVESVTIPSEVTTIVGTAFYGCEKVRSVTFTPYKSLSEIFPRSYENITNVVMNAGSTTVCSWACSGCVNLICVTIPDSVTTIGGRAFYGCSNLNDVTIPSSVKTIGASAFEGCNDLTHVDAMNLEKWWEIAFGNATANPLYYGKHLLLNGSEITALSVPTGISSIANYVFYNAASIESVAIPPNVTSIGANAFTGCTRIRTIEIPASYNVATVFPSSYAAITNAAIPEGTTAISENGYKGCASLTKIAIPPSVTNIGASAFEGCSELVRVDITDLAKWCGIAFENNTANPLCYGKHLFLNGSEITALGVPASVSSIADYAFYNASLIESVTIPSSVTSIGANAFTGCTGIRTIDIPASYNVATVFPNAYSAITKITVPNGTTTIAANAYKGCSSVTAVEVPASVTTIGSGAFQDCSSLKSVTFKGQAPACGDNVFTGTSADMVVYAENGTSGWTQWNGRPLAFIDAGGGSEEPEVVEKAQLTVTNVVIHYVVNSVVPTKTYPATYDTGFVNIITEVKSGGAVSVPATWMVNYPDYVTKFGGDFTKSLMRPTGKRDAMGNPMCVWQDYVAGTDPTDEEDVFTASITMDDNGKIVVSYNPELNDDEKAKRQYTTYGKKSLTDQDWVVVPAGSEADYNFFKVTVEMK